MELKNHSDTNPWIVNHGKDDKLYFPWSITIWWCIMRWYPMMATKHWLPEFHIECRDRLENTQTVTSMRLLGGMMQIDWLVTKWEVLGLCPDILGTWSTKVIRAKWVQYGWCDSDIHMLRLFHNSRRNLGSETKIYNQSYLKIHQWRGIQIKWGNFLNETLSLNIAHIQNHSLSPNHATSDCQTNLHCHLYLMVEIYNMTAITRTISQLILLLIHPRPENLATFNCRASWLSLLCHCKVCPCCTTDA